MSLSRMFEYYDNLSKPVKASLWFTVCNILQKGISMLSMPIFTRILTPEQYGVYSVYQSWYHIVIIFATLNLFYGVYNKGLTKFHNDKEKFTSSMLGLSTVLTCGLFIVYLFGMDFWNNLLGLSTLYIVLMFIELLFVPAYSFWAASQRFEYEYKKLIFVTFIIAIGSPLIGIIAVLSTEYKAEARVLSYVLLQACIGLVFYIYIMYKGKKMYIKEYWKYALMFNIPLIPHYLSLTVLQQSDRIIISNMIGTDKAAIYSVAYNISTMMSLITTAINNSFVPYTYKSLKNKEYHNIGRQATFLLIIVAIGCVVAMAFAPEIIRIFASQDYYEAIWIVPPVAASVYFMFIYPLFGNIEFYFEKTKFVMVASCVGAILNIILNCIFIPVWGYLAAGYTTMVCYLIFTLAHYTFYKKIVKDKIGDNVSIYNVKSMILISIVLIIAVIVTSMLYNSDILRYIFITLLLFILFYKRHNIILCLKEIKK